MKVKKEKYAVHVDDPVDESMHKLQLLPGGLNLVVDAPQANVTIISTFKEVI